MAKKLKARTYISFNAAVAMILRRSKALAGPYEIAQITAEQAEADETPFGQGCAEGKIDFGPNYDDEYQEYYEVHQGGAHLGTIRQSWAREDNSPMIVSAIAIY